MKPVTTRAKKKRKARNKNLETNHRKTLEDTGYNMGGREEGAQRLN